MVMIHEYAMEIYPSYVAEPSEFNSVYDVSGFVSL
jgi:hypothetical protein